jgi:iron complex outermembrane receptor protein
MSLLIQLICLAQGNRADTLTFVSPTEIVVTASRTSVPLASVPFSVSVVGQSALAGMQRASSFDEPLAFVPGVKVDNQTNGSLVHISMRGQGILTERGIRGIKILYDGIPANDPSGFAPDMFDVDLNTVDRIEVLRGAAASLYGGGASGGIVNIMTENAVTESAAADASIGLGSNGFAKAFGQFGGNTGEANYRISFSRMMGDGYREHTHFQGDNLYGKLVFTPSNSLTITPVLAWTKAYHENPEGITLDDFHQNPRLANEDAVPFNEHLETERTTAGLTGIAQLGGGHGLQFNGYAKRTLFTEANNATFVYRTIITPGASAQYSFNSGQPESFLANSLNVGTDVQWQTIDEHRVDNLYSIPGDTVRSREQIRESSVAFFGFDRLTLGKGWGVEFGLRYEMIRNELSDQLKDPVDLSGSADFRNMTAHVGVTYSPAQDVSVFASWAQGFLPPSTEELSQNPDNFGGFNTRLTYATSNSFDVGFRGKMMRYLYLDVTGFLLSTANDFDRYRIPDTLRNQETFYRNVGSSRRLGVELYVRYNPIEIIELQASYTFSHFIYTNSVPIPIVMDDPDIMKSIVSGSFLPNSPRHQYSLGGRVNLTGAWSLTLSIEGMSKTYIDGANIETEAAPGYALVNGRLAYNWQMSGLSGEVWFAAKNIFDVKYLGFTEPDPGGFSYQPGPGREVFAGIRVHL